MNEQQNIPSTVDEIVAASVSRPDEIDDGQWDFVAPRTTETTARLQIVPGASHVTIVAAPDLPDLCRARFEGRPPETWARDGVVTFRYPRHSAVDLVKEALGRDDRAATIVLNGAVAWRIEVDGGASRFVADLGRLRLDALRVAGGASRVEVTLPRAAGVVPIQIDGGASRVTVHRPAGVAAALRVRGGTTRLTFDEQHAGAIGGEVRWQSPDFASAADRYEIEIGGGASELTIDIR